MMHWQYNPYVFPLLGAAAVSAAVAFFAWRRRPAPSAMPLVFLMLAASEWSLGYALGMASADLPAKVFWAKVQYFGIVSVPVMWLILALQYTNREKWLTRRNRVLLAIVPLLTLLLAWTNDGHGLIWSDMRLDTSGSFSVLYLSYGAFFWVWVIYSYSLVLLGSVLLLQTLVRSPHLYRRQAVAMLIAALAPWVGNVLRISGLNLFPHLDLTNFAFTLSGLAVAWALLRFRLLDIVPVARDAIIEGMSDGVMVLDAQNRIVDLNPAAQRIIGRPASEAIGQPAAQVLSGRPDLVERYGDVTEAQAEIVLGEGEAQRCFDLRILPLYDRRGRLTGRLVVLRDVTERKRAEEALRQWTHDLDERVKELNCLYGISALVDKPGILPEEIFQGIVDLIPPAWRYPEAACARIILEGQEFTTENFRETTRKQTADIIVRGERIGRVEVCYLEEKPERYEGPFLQEERNLINAIAERVESIVERKRAEEALKESEEKYRDLFENANDLIQSVALDGRFVYVNRAWREALGYDEEEIASLSMFDVIHPDSLAHCMNVFQRVMSGEQADKVEAVFVTKDGRGIMVEGNADCKFVDGKPVYTRGIFRDITERKQMEKERERLLLAEHGQRLLAETLAEVTLTLTSRIGHGAVLDEILRQAQRIVPYSTANIALLEGETLRVARWRGYEAFGGEELVSSLVQKLADLTVDIEVIQSRQPLVVPDTHQEPRWVVFPDTAWIRSYLVVPICLHDQVLGLLRLDSDTPGGFSVEDAERLQPLANAAAIALENARLFAEVQRLAITDGLTGMYNRRHFFELAEHELNRARRFGHPVSAIMLDLDHFKQVNDTYGHAVGDQVLRVVAERCGESIRDIDVLGRYGGEEFAIILPGTDLSGTQTMAERLRRSVADVPIPTDKGDLTVTISLGVASNAHDDGDVAALLNRADAAMYAAKQAGRNRVAVIER